MELFRNQHAGSWQDKSRGERAVLPHAAHATFRDDARTVYVAMVEELGPEYLGFAIGVLRSALPSRGYTGHVQGYTVHAVLQVVMKVLLP